MLVEFPGRDMTFGLQNMIIEIHFDNDHQNLFDVLIIECLPQHQKKRGVYEQSVLLSSHGPGH